ncbi:hypothetical protein BDV59DRAFT_14605 [Aspergillus ambiguus]|uniref:Zn(II)2Cys6 transcription factor domain-containing protein n=1 Tax=Aspergillus ambiguus TaxID=176160 RepID=UPI003CCD893E
MVAVPHSTGCSRCIQRRIKCDESRPGCRRCELRGLQCPGYQRSLKFLPVRTPSNSGKTRDPAYQLVNSTSERRSLSTKSAVAQGATRSDVSYNNVDELIAPSLAQKALNTQGIELLNSCIDVAVPGLYYSYSTRVAVNWMGFARYNAESTLDPFIWAVRCWGTLHVGTIHRDIDKIASSRAMYGRSLIGLCRLLQDPRTARSDMTLAIAIMLGVFEMLDGITSQSWLTHSSGISTLIRLRGPEAHRSGFGRTLLISFKSFIVTDALIRGKPCFLAEPAWKSMLCDSLKEEKAKGKDSRLGNLVELSFMEVVECPGLYARTCAMIKARDTDHGMRQKLLDATLMCRERLHHLKIQLESDFPARIHDEQLRNKPDLIGSIPVWVARKLMKFALHGSESALALLDQLIVLIKSDYDMIGMSPEVSTSPTRDAFPAPSILPFTIMGREKTPAGSLTEWPDQLALSMGMLCLKDAVYV